MKSITLEEARKQRYGAWSGNPNGCPYNPGHCVMEVHPSCGWIPAQCRRRNGHGPDGLYCKQHAKQVVAKFATSETKTNAEVE